MYRSAGFFTLASVAAVFRPSLLNHADFGWDKLEFADLIAHPVQWITAIAAGFVVDTVQEFYARQSWCNPWMTRFGRRRFGPRIISVWFGRCRALAEQY